MKKILPILVLIVFIIVVAVLIKNGGPKPVGEGPVSSEFCFYREQAATKVAPYKVSEYIILNIEDGKVHGIKRGEQSGPDMTNGYSGDLEGTIKGKDIEAVYSYTIEGSENQELEVYELNSDSLIKKRWVLVEKNGILVPDRKGAPSLITYTKENCDTPETLPTKYIHTVDWPPQVNVIDEAISCLDAGEENVRAGKTETRIINGHEYCVTTVSDGAAGSTYTQYAYARVIKDKTSIFTFSLRFVQCGNYDEPERKACETERKNFDIDKIIDPIIESIRLSQTEKINYTNSNSDMIQVEVPFPGAVTGKEFSVVGKARGPWFFEASFPIELLDENGKVLAQSHAEAQSEWMTTDFVPFKGEIKAPSSYIGKATLVLKKDNASGLPEHDASISFPITVEY